MKSVRIGEHYEYTLTEGEPTLQSNSHKRQRVRVEMTNEYGVELSFKAGEHWLRGRSLSHATIASMFEKRDMVQVDGDLKPKASSSSSEDAPEKMSNRELLIKHIESTGLISTSELAKYIGKPTAATNSILSSLLRAGTLKVTRSEDGLNWSLT